MMSTPSAGSVVLLHDQLQDARIWHKLAGQLASPAALQTVSVPPIHSLGRPGAWADHIGYFAREAISPGTVDLVATIGGAGEAGIRLVGDRLARRALLLNPDPKPVLTADSTASDSARQLLRTPGMADKLEQFFQTLGRDVVQDLAIHGSLSPEGIDELVTAIIEVNEHLPQADRELVRRIATEQLTATLPLDMEAQRRGVPERPDWATLLAPVSDRCTIAVTAGPLNDWLGAVLARRVPGVPVVQLASPSSSAWLSAPHEISALIHDLLRRTTAGSE